jgi:uncharacterized protein (TIGR02001 family)
MRFDLIRTNRVAAGIAGALLLLAPDLAAAQSAPAVTITPNAPAPALAPGNAAAETATPGPGITFDSIGVTINGSASAGSDYLFRGISQTRNTWAFQGTLDAQHESGVYVGAFVSNVKFLAQPFNNARQELDILAGYRFTLADISFDLGYVAYLYPGQSKPEGTQLNEYQEIVGKVAYTVGETGNIGTTKLQATVAYSPNFFGRSGTGWYVEGGADMTLPFEVTLFGRLGQQWIQNNPRFGTPDYLWYGVGISREIYWGFTASVGFYGTNISRRDCVPLSDRAPGGQFICSQRALFVISKTL